MWVFSKKNVWRFVSFMHCLLCKHSRCTIKTHPLAVLYCEVLRILQGSVATRLRSGRTFDDNFITNLPPSLSVNEFWKLVNIRWDYEHKSSDTYHTQRVVNDFVVWVILSYVHYECLSSTSALVKQDEYWQLLLLIVYHLLHKCFHYIE